MLARTVSLLLLSVVVLCKDAPKKVAEDKTPDKRGATSYTQVVHGSTGLDPVLGRSAGGYYGGHEGAVQLAYIPVSGYHGYGGLYNAVPVPHQYPVAVEKRVPYFVTVPVERPVPVHLIKQYPIAIEKPVTYAVDRPVPYQIPLKVPVAYAVPKPYHVPTPVPSPVYVKAGNGYGHDEYNSDEDSGYNGGYTGNKGYNKGGRGYDEGNTYSSGSEYNGGGGYKEDN